MNTLSVASAHRIHSLDATTARKVSRQAFDEMLNIAAVCHRIQNDIRMSSCDSKPTESLHNQHESQDYPASPCIPSATSPSQPNGSKKRSSPQFIMYKPRSRNTLTGDSTDFLPSMMYGGESREQENAHLYDMATWNMYHRIKEARIKRDMVVGAPSDSNYLSTMAQENSFSKQPWANLKAQEDPSVGLNCESYSHDEEDDNDVNIFQLDLDY